MKSKNLKKPTALTKENVKKVNSLDDLLNLRYGKKGTELRDNFDAKIEAFLLVERLKEFRHQVGLTQKELSQKTGLDKTFISRVENGKVDIQLSTFLRILNGLGKSMQFT